MLKWLIVSVKPLRFLKLQKVISQFDPSPNILALYAEHFYSFFVKQSVDV